MNPGPADKQHNTNRKNFIPPLSSLRAGGGKASVLERKGQARLPDPEPITASSDKTEAPSVQPRLRLMPRAHESHRVGKPLVNTGQPLPRAVCCLLLRIAELQPEFVAESLRKPTSGQRAIPMRRLDPRARAAEEIVPHFPRGRTHSEQVRVLHFAEIGEESSPVVWQFRAGQSEQPRQGPALGKIGIQFAGRE